MLPLAFTTTVAFLLLQGVVPDPLLHLASSFGLGGVMFFFYRRDVVGARDNYEKIIKENTAAITHLITSIDRGTMSSGGK